MYGLKILAVKDLIVTKFGEKTWKKICAAANVPDDYVQSQNYPEDILGALISAAAKALDITAQQVLEASGYWFIPFVRTTEYGRMLSMTGKTFSECLKNLNAMHGHLRIAHFHSMFMPNIRCTMETERRAKIHYTPGKEMRKGLGPLLVGIVYALAEIVYGITEISIQPVKSVAKGSEEFLLVWSEEGDSAGDEDDSGGPDNEESPLTVGVTGVQLGALFPFHVLFNESLEIIQWGPSMARIAPLIALGKKFSSLFIVTSPANNGQWTSDDALSWQSELMMLKCDEVVLQGQFLALQINGPSRMIGFFGSPKFKTIEEATSRQLALSDYAIHDQTKDVLFAIDAQTFAAAAKAMKKEQKKEKERERKHKSGKSNAESSAGTGTPGVKPDRLPANLKTHFTGQMDPRKSLYANLFGSNVREPDLHKHMGNGVNNVVRAKTPHIESDGSTDSVRTPGKTGAIPSFGTCAVRAKPEEVALPVGAYLPRLTTAFHEIWLKESWTRFPLSRTIVLTAFQLESSDEKPTQNMYMAVARLALSKQRLSALIRAILEPEISDAMNGSSSLLRADSPATRTIHAAFELAGGLEYLRGAIASTQTAIQRFAEIEEKALESSSWERAHGAKIAELAQVLLDSIFASVAQLPPGVRRMMIDIHDLVSRRIPDMAISVPQMLLFLRFVNPAIISPERSLFGRRHTVGGLKVATAVAKVIQALVNTSDEKADSSSKADNQAQLMKFLKELLDDTKLPAFPNPSERSSALALATVQEFMIENLEKLLATASTHTAIAKDARASILNFVSVVLSEAVLHR